MFRLGVAHIYTKVVYGDSCQNSFSSSRLWLKAFDSTAANKTMNPFGPRVP